MFYWLWLSSLSTGGGLHGLHAQPKRTWSGKGCQEEGGTLRTACREGALHCTAQFVIALWPLTLARALSALTWETWWPQWKAIFLYHGNHVCNNTNRVPTVRPTTWDFFFHGYTDGQKIHRQNTVISFFFCPNTVTAYVKSYTLYCIYAILTPAELYGGVCVTHWHPWWWASLDKGGGCTVR